MFLRFLTTVLMTLLLSCGAGLAQTGENALVVEVKDAAGQPLRNACVTFVPREGEVTFRKVDRSGKVKLKRLAPGSYRVVVKVDGYEAQKKQVEVDGAGTETVAFSLQPRELK
jgi:hypothetical protein